MPFLPPRKLFVMLYPRGAFACMRRSSNATTPRKLDKRRANQLKKTVDTSRQTEQSNKKGKGGGKGKEGGGKGGKGGGGRRSEQMIEALASINRRGHAKKKGF